MSAKFFHNLGSKRESKSVEGKARLCAQAWLSRVLQTFKKPKPELNETVKRKQHVTTHVNGRTLTCYNIYERSDWGHSHAYDVFMCIVEMDTPALPIQIQSDPLSNRSSVGGWVSYVVGVACIHVLIRTMPFIHGEPLTWTLTNLIHNVCMYLMLHQVKGAPWENTDQGKSRRLTHWEQIDSGQQFTETRKFLIILPIAMFLLTSYFTHYAWDHFVINAVTLVFVILPKLPQFHKVRIFDINKY